MSAFPAKFTCKGTLRHVFNYLRPPPLLGFLFAVVKKFCRFGIWSNTQCLTPRCSQHNPKPLPSCYTLYRLFRPVLIHTGHCRRRCRWHRRQICHRCRWYRCRWYRWCTFTCEYLREFSKKFKTVLMGYSGAGGKLIHEKNHKQKISWHCPFNNTTFQNAWKMCICAKCAVHPCEVYCAVRQKF